jgi:hypothetical protein
MKLIKLFRNYPLEYGVAEVDYHDDDQSGSDLRTWIIKEDWGQFDGNATQGEMFDRVEGKLREYQQHQKAFLRTADIFRLFNGD